jgi:TolB-like protein/Flp pilus assembly protein TadD
MTSLVDRLKERKLVQWALAYLAGAWLLLQVLDVLGQNFDWPRAFFRAATVVLAIGFFAALVLAWYHGEKGRQRASGPELLMLAVLFLLAGVAVTWVSRDAGPAEASPVGTAEPFSTAPATEAERHSVAVLPFANLSESRENEYFSDGITDEILTTLANVRDLRVISRTSVMQYKGTAKPLRQIASELGVAHVLEGSVQRAGERVRINVQLIDAATDAHLWAQRYDRPLENIFAVQSEIAQQIARALQARLSAGERARIERRRTDNLEAYDYFLEGREFVRRGTPHADPALFLLRKARALDPGYPDVYASLSEVFAFRFIITGDRAVLDSAVVTARRATQLDPQLAYGHVRLGIALNLQGDRDGALQANRRAVQLNPNASDGLANLYQYDFGRLDEAARWWTSARRNDPTNSVLNWLAARNYLHLGMPERARSLLEKAIEFNPAFPWSYSSLIPTFLLEGRTEEAGAEVLRMLTATGEGPEALVWAGRTMASLGDFRAARGYLERAPIAGGAQREAALGTLTLAWILQRSGEADRARTLVREAAGQLEQWWGSPPTRPEGLVDLARVRVLEGNREDALRQMEAAVRHGWRLIYEWPMDPILDSLRGDPRFDRLMAEVMADVARQRARVEREGW